jgi:hypothetical protein
VGVHGAFAHKNTGDLQGENLQKKQYQTLESREKRQSTRNNKEQREKQAETIQKQCTRGPRSSRQQKNRRRAAAATFALIRD